MTNYSETYYRQSASLLQILPYLNKTPSFALKGGTAINFFYQNMPRLSVDIDLTYLPIHSREQTLLEIKNSLITIANAIKNDYPETKISLDKTPNIPIPKLQIQKNNDIVKIEVNPVFRGTVFPTEERLICEKAQNLFENYLTVKTLSLPDLYAGKFCAALNRQHPRDLFDVKLLLETHGITESIRQAFIIYLACDRRPLHELLKPNIKPYHLQEKLHETSFAGMVEEQITYHDLSEIVKILSDKVQQQMTQDEKQFLLTLTEGKPNWQLMPFNHLKELPAMQWKVLNVNKMDAAKRKQHYNMLEKFLFE